MTMEDEKKYYMIDLSMEVMFAKREAVEWKRDPTMPTYEEWCNQMLGGNEDSKCRISN